MVNHLLFLTGKLAEKSLEKVLAEFQKTQKKSSFSYHIEQIGVSVAALMTPDLIARRLKQIGNADRVIVPGLCQGDLKPLEEKYGIPFERGPEDLKDLPQYFGHQGAAPDLKDYRVRIFAEIVDAPHLSVDAIIARAQHYRKQGANVIDLGCLPGVPFKHLPDAVKALKQQGMQVSVDSLNSDDLLAGGNAGADYLLSLTEKSLWIAEEVSAIPILIPAKPHDMSSLYRAIETCIKKEKSFIADAILDPIHFGLTDSIVRYHKLRKRYPHIPIMMGVGNLTELTDADTTGINAVLFGLISELDVDAVLVTSVSPHAVNAIAEADLARRMMYAAKQDERLPRGYSQGLMGLHDRRPFPYEAEEINALASQIKDPSFRIQVSREGVHIYNRDGLFTGQDPFALYPHLQMEDDASHAFYLGVELARAQIAWRLNKRYVQDQPLEWGATSSDEDASPKIAHREAALKEKRVKKSK